MTAPYGCAECGEAERSHGGRFTNGTGYHNWLPPGPAHILARMRWRRWQKLEKARWWAKFNRPYKTPTPDEWVATAPLTAKERNRLELVIKKKRGDNRS